MKEKEPNHRAVTITYHPACLSLSQSARQWSALNLCKSLSRETETPTARALIGRSGVRILANIHNGVHVSRFGIQQDQQEETGLPHIIRAVWSMN
jgi:hypothetical protein